MDEITTADGRTVRTGDRVFNFYDGWWGRIHGPIDAQGWFLVLRDGCTRQAVLNGERVAIRVPRSSPMYDLWIDGLDDLATRR